MYFSIKTIIDKRKSRTLTGPPDLTCSSMKESRELSSVCSRFGRVVKATGFGIVRHCLGGAGVVFCQ